VSLETEEARIMCQFDEKILTCELGQVTLLWNAKAEINYHDPWGIDQI
jgi:hypothetical protein